MPRETILQYEFESEDNALSAHEEFMEIFFKSHPKPVVRYYGGDLEYEKKKAENQSEDLDRTGSTCSKHGSPINLNGRWKASLGDRSYTAKVLECYICRLEYEWSAKPAVSADYKNEKNPWAVSPLYWHIAMAAKRGQKGDLLPLKDDWQKYIQLRLWENLRDNYSRKYGAYLKAHENELMLKPSKVAKQ